MLAVAYSRDGNYLAAGDEDMMDSIFGTLDFQMVRQVPFDDIVSVISFTAHT